MTARADAPNPRAYSDPRELLVSPVKAPAEALRHRLLPLESERTPGDAAPIYLRLGLQAAAGPRGELQQNLNDWSNLPPGQLPVAEARKVIDRWSQALQQLEFGARRQTCRWDYTLAEQKERVIEVTLPDAQEMRHWTRLQVLKARVEIAERRFDDAARSIETGLSMARHAAEGPFLINTLVGVAGAQVMLGDVEEWIAQPDAPSLYWPLNALPRPLVGIRKAMETEEVMFEWLFPEVLDLDRPRTDAEWAAALTRLHARMRETEAKTMVTDKTGVHPLGSRLTTLEEFRKRALPEARAYVKERPGSPAAMTDDQAILRYIAGRYREVRDDQYKYAYLPYPDAVRASAGAEERLKALKGGPLSAFSTLMPSLMTVYRAEARLDRTVAMLRVIEALRLHAAEHGKLPGSLAEVTAVPIPLDPMTAKPFEYRLEGETAVLVGPETLPQFVLTYRVALRK